MARRLTIPPLSERLLAKVVKHDVDCSCCEGCWHWIAKKNDGGYGRIKDGGRDYQAHRVSYELFIGPIPAGLTLDHLCRNCGCVNPAHLEPVTMAENIRRGTSPSAFNAQKTHCPQGHPYSGDNLGVRANGTRYCLICHRRYRLETERRRRAKLRSAVCDLCRKGAPCARCKAKTWRPGL